MGTRLRENVAIHGTMFEIRLKDLLMLKGDFFSNFFGKLAMDNWMLKCAIKRYAWPSWGHPSLGLECLTGLKQVSSSNNVQKSHITAVLHIQYTASDLFQRYSPLIKTSTTWPIAHSGKWTVLASKHLPEWSIVLCPAGRCLQSTCSILLSINQANPQLHIGYIL